MNSSHRSLPHYLSKSGKHSDSCTNTLHHFGSIQVFIICVLISHATWLQISRAATSLNTVRLWNSLLVKKWTRRLPLVSALNLLGFLALSVGWYTDADLLDGYRLNLTSAISYTFHENGYNANVSCIYNTTSDFQLVQDDSEQLYEAVGYLPGSNVSLS